MRVTPWAGGTGMTRGWKAQEGVRSAMNEGAIGLVREDFPEEASSGVADEPEVAR